MGDEQERTMYVGNLGEDVTDDLLYELFLQAGPLQSVKRVKDRETGRPKNFAFVMFTHAASVPYAIHLTNGLRLLGRPLKTQQRNNVDLPHFLSVGVHNIDSESELQERLVGGDIPSAEDYSKRDDSGYRSNGRQDEGHFKPKPLDPNQVWKNNIDYHQQQESNRCMSNAAMVGGSPHMMPDNSHRNSGKSPSNSYGGASHARSASHYHQMSSNILDQMSSGSGNVRSRLGSASYRSTRDDRSGSYSNYNASRSYDDGHSYGGRDDPTRRHNRSSGGYSPYDVNMQDYGNNNSKYGANQYHDSNNDRRGFYGNSDSGGYGGPERMQHRLGGSPQDGRSRSFSYGNRDGHYRHNR